MPSRRSFRASDWYEAVAYTIHPGLKASPMLVHKYIGENGSAAMPAPNRSAGVTPEVNLRISFHAGNEACKE